MDVDWIVLRLLSRHDRDGWGALRNHNWWYDNGCGLCRRLLSDGGFCESEGAVKLSIGSLFKSLECGFSALDMILPRLSFTRFGCVAFGAELGDFSGILSNCGGICGGVCSGNRGTGMSFCGSGCGFGLSLCSSSVSFGVNFCDCNVAETCCDFRAGCSDQCFEGLTGQT
jgi:hypothetical protein